MAGEMDGRPDQGFIPRAVFIWKCASTTWWPSEGTRRWLACLLSYPAQGTGSLGVRHKIKFSRINIPDSLSGQGPGAGAKNELGSILDCVMAGGPRGLLAPGLQLPLLRGLASPTGQLWPGSGGYEVGGREGIAEANFLVLGPVYLPEG